MKITSKILFIEIVNILKKIKNNPNHPKIIAIESMIEPRSRCNKFSIEFLINSRHFNLINYLFIKKCSTLFSFKFFVIEMIYELKFTLEA